MAVPDWEPISGWNPWGSTRLLFLRWDRTTPIGTSHYWISYQILYSCHQVCITAIGCRWVFKRKYNPNLLMRILRGIPFANKSDGNSLIPTKDRIYILYKAGLGAKGFHMAFHYCTTSSPTPTLPPSYDGLKYIVDIYKGFTRDTGYFLSSGTIKSLHMPYLLYWENSRIHSWNT